MSAHMRFALTALVVLGTVHVHSGPALAIIVGGGGGSRLDCLSVFDAPVNYPETRPRSIRCVDGDSSCDADGVVNGVCQFQVSVCANSTFNPTACDVQGVRLITVEHALDNGDPKFDTQFQALQTRINSDIGPFPVNTADKCSTPTNISVTFEGPLKDNKCKRTKKTIELVTESTVQAGQGVILLDKDRLELVCEPPDPCDPGTIFGGTYDRVQRQIFDQHCAVSGCHDSNSFTNSANLLLEASAFPDNLINHVPDHTAAAALGWYRIDQLSPTMGDVDKSFLIHKLNGDFPNTGGDFGLRMPRLRPKLDQTLIDVVTLWVQAGAPATGWVPGTD